MFKTVIYRDTTSTSVQKYPTIAAAANAIKREMREEGRAINKGRVVNVKTMETARVVEWGTIGIRERDPMESEV